jgi:hypothetical protein
MRPDEPARSAIPSPAYESFVLVAERPAIDQVDPKVEVFQCFQSRDDVVLIVVLKIKGQQSFINAVPPLTGCENRFDNEPMVVFEAEWKLRIGANAECPSST